MALQHSNLLAYNHQQAKELKKSNAELQIGIETQKAISSIVAKIRSSLDMDVVFLPQHKQYESYLKQIECQFVTKLLKSTEVNYIVILG